MLPAGLTQIEWTAADGSGNTASCLFNVLVQAGTGMKAGKTGPVRFFPNPSEGVFHYSHDKDLIHRIRVMDITGTILLEEFNQKGEGNIDLSAFGPGIYICGVETEAGSFLYRLIKH